MQSKEEGNRFSLGRACDIMASGGGFIFDWPVFYAVSAGTWKNDAVGWWYCNSDGSYVKNNWQQIDGKWYFFDENGYRKTGWVSWKEQWYFLNENGEMLTNPVTPDGKYVGEDGVLAAHG